jgi:hypothetical protein
VGGGGNTAAMVLVALLAAMSLSFVARRSLLRRRPARAPAR